MHFVFSLAKTSVLNGSGSLALADQCLLVSELTAFKLNPHSVSTRLSQVVQPLCFFLAEQIDLAGQQEGEDPSLRIAYDDVDEHCCSPASVLPLIALLKGEYGGSSPADDLWTALEQVGWHCTGETADCLCGMT